MVKALSSEEIEAMALEVVEFLVSHKLWMDVTLYFNDSVYETWNRETKEHSYNDLNKLFRFDNVNPYEHIKDARKPHILSFSCDSRLYEVLNYNLYEFFDEGIYHENDDFVYKIKDDFWEIFSKWGVWMECISYSQYTCMYFSDI